MPDLSDSVLWSEIDSNNNAASPNGWPEGMMPSGVNDSARADRGALKRFWDRVNPVQIITPSGGVYTFTTANPAYPTRYIDGEIYAFRPTAGSVGGDQLQVNALAPKPILKRVGPGAGSFAPIIAQDIVAAVPAQFVYDAAQNTGAGAFILLNPWVPISGDGTGGVSVPGELTVAGILTMLGPVSMLGPVIAYDGMQVTGQLKATGYTSRSGLGGPYQTNAFNIQWTGADGAHLWIDATDLGPIVTGAAGNVVIGGNASVGSLTVSGNTTVTGRAALMQVDFGASQASRTGYFDGSNGNFSANGNATIGGNLSVTGNLTAVNITAAGQLSSTGSNAALSFQDRGGVSAGWLWYATGGTARLYNGLDRLTITAAGALTASSLTVSGASSLMGTAISSGNIDTPGFITSRNMVQVVTTGATNAQMTLANGVRSWSPFVGVDGSFYIYDNTGGQNRLYINPSGQSNFNGHVMPATDGAFICGGAASAWSVVEAYSLVTKPSDPALKHDIESVPAGCLDLVRAIEPKMYKLNIERGADKTHWGFMAPDISEAMDRAGHKFGGVHTEDGVSGLVYAEITAVLWAAVRELAERLERK